MRIRVTVEFDLSQALLSKGKPYIRKLLKDFISSWEKTFKMVYLDVIWDVPKR